ncbi:MAG: class I SAM-dependent methyltransferase, partial [Acidimicrobiia bacterium]|nr:class I SAM-dependent methyltransferase [Acidimicrobiia bacterium]
MRQRMPDGEIEKIRADRIKPRLSHPHGLHLAAVKRALVPAIAELPQADDPILDLYCGVQPYRRLLASRRVIGVDIDLRFGSADVVGDIPLPFRNGAFSAVLCTQALYFRQDDREVVSEMHRLVAPGGQAVVTVPYLWRKESAAFERRYHRRELEELFSGWSSVSVRGEGGLGTGLAYHLGSLVAGIGRGLPAVQPLVAGSIATVNTLGRVIDWLTSP